MRHGKGMFLFLFLFITTGLQPAGAELHTYLFSRDSMDITSGNVRIDLDSRWEYTEDGQTWKSLTLPFFFTDRSRADVRCFFQADSVWSDIPVHLVSHGFGCALRIYLNGNLIHTQANDYTPFSFDLPRHYLKPGQENEFRFELFLPASDENGFPSYPALQRSPGYVGITRPLFLRPAGDIWIDQFRQQVASSGNTVELDYAYNIRLRTADNRVARIEERFFNDEGQVIFRRSFRYDQGTNPVANSISLSEDNLWSPERPSLITVRIFHLNEINQAIHSYRMRFGIRSIRISGRDLRLNGDPLKLQGMNYHENLLDYRGHTYEDRLRDDFQMMKEMGVNAVRFPHYVPAPFAVHLADSLGIMLFGEIPIWRYPLPLYKSDHLLESAKQSIQNLSLFYRPSAAFCGLSLGQQIPLHHPTTQKFMLILKRYTESNLDVLTLLSPLPGKPFPAEPAADLYMFESFGSFRTFSTGQHFFSLNAGISTIPVLRRQPVADDADLRLQQELKSGLDFAMKFNGGFIEAFTDYYTEIPVHINRREEPYPLLPAGILTLEREPKMWSRDIIGELWQTEETPVLEARTYTKQRNLFSIVIFFATILFFVYYKQNLRFRDNLKRSIRHPYGFFVDMRERRIIPLFNSIIAGGYYSAVLSVFFSAFIIYYNDSLQIQEFMSTLLAGTDLYRFFLEMSLSPSYSMGFCFLVFFLYPLLFSITIKILSFFSRHRIRFRQGLAIGFWSGAPFLFMAPVALVSYHLLQRYLVDHYLWYIFLFFILWAHYRIINGIRVLFASKFRKVLIMLLLSYSIPLVIFWAILKPEQYWFEYLKLLLEAQGLY